MESRDFFEQLESFCKGLALVVVPVILAFAGHAVNGHLESQKLAIQQQQAAIQRQQADQEVLKEAMAAIFHATDSEKLFGKSTSIEARRLYRAHWLKVYKEYGRVEIPDEFVAAVMEQAAYDLASVPSADKKTGWVAVGLFDTRRQGDLNFDLPIGKDRLENGMIIRARWSMPLRESFYEPYGGEGVNSQVYRLAGGQCATVIEIENEVRRQSWAKVEVLDCKLAESHRVAQAN